MTDLALLVLRVFLGIMFFAHGLNKAFGFFGGQGISGFTQLLSGLGFSPAPLWAYIGAYTELIGGLFLVAGLYVRGASLLLLILIVVAALKVHMGKGFFIMQGGFEYTFIIAGVCLAIILAGPDKYCLLKKF